ncbi:MAG: GNAT family N-acetyltransferase [Sulfurovaceae bacterium]|nr:GNAT family N-acetyltransferase [Sulfurovaceae bacterium]
MTTDLWQVYYTAIRLVCAKDYSDEQIKAWAPDNFDMKIFEEQQEILNPFVAKLGATIVGYADLQPNGLIDHFFVHGKYQSMGVGGALMNAILQKGHSMSKLYSHVSMTAKPFSQHYDFTVKKVQKVEVRGCKMKNNIMELIKSNILTIEFTDSKKRHVFCNEKTSPFYDKCI